ncbi:MAG TPA: MFS transporter [Humisphaera sp.]|nr:MFS transporter [Humisphaera sp.]
MPEETQKLSVIEKAGYSAADAAANFVFMTMILFQANFYTDVMGLAAGAAGTIILIARLWDAFFDPLMGVLADRTDTRWGKFRPWVLFTALPWGVVMYLAYRAPVGWSGTATLMYAAVTNILLMTIYSCNNMPYSALGGVMTGNVDERASLNSYRFVAVNIAQFIVGGFTLPLVAKFAGASNDRRHGWAMTMGLWAVICVVLFLITFATTRERIRPISHVKSTPRQDFADLLKNSPWVVMFFMTLAHFTILSLRGGALYDYYHYYADKAALYDWVAKLGLTSPDGAHSSGLLETLGYIVHGGKADLAKSNVADVANSLINMLGTATIIIVILASPALARAFGKKVIAVTGFALAATTHACFYLLKPTNVGGMVALTIINAIVYAPTIPLVWAMYADVADYSEWRTGRRATGIIFATIGFALKAGLSLGSFILLQLLSAYGYQANVAQTPHAMEGIRLCATLIPSALFAFCALLLICYKINKRLTHQIADELTERRRQADANLAVAG